MLVFSTEIPKDTLCPLILVTLGFRLRPPTPQGVILSLSNFWDTQKHEAKPSGISVGYAQDDMAGSRANEISMRQRIPYPPHFANQPNPPPLTKCFHTVGASCARP